MKHRRGQLDTANAALLIALIMIFIIIYILFLPPSVREELLTQPIVSPYTNFTGPEIIVPINESLKLSQQARLYRDREDMIFDIEPFYLKSYTEPVDLIQPVDSVYLKSSLFDRKIRVFRFSTPPEQTSNVYLAISNIKKGKGRLIVKINGVEVFNDEIRSGSKAIALQNIQENNVLTLEVSGVGARFWARNEYILENVKVTASVINIQQQRGVNTFFIPEVDNIEEIESSYLIFRIGSCRQASVGLLNIYLNGYLLQSKIPDCESAAKIEFDPRYLEVGTNELVFSSEKGSYLVDLVKIKINFERPQDYVYRFKLEDFLFTEIEKEPECGDVDGLCPVGCDEDEDIDCCLGGSRDNYWCDVETDDIDDRCASSITEEKCARCPSGYERADNEPPIACEGKCGDDTDGECPEDCKEYYDKDCCFISVLENYDYTSLQPANRYWCDDVPKSGLESVCETAISRDECDDCPSGYEGALFEPECEPLGEVRYVREVLRSPYRVTLIVDFIDDGKRKEANIYINGNRVDVIDTREDRYNLVINDYVRSGNNYVQIEPFKTFDVLNIEVKVEG